MKIYHHINDFVKLDNAVVTIGTYDGVHIGHQKIISRLKEVAEKTDGETVILTFFPHPRMILNPGDSNLKMITTINEKAELLEKAGIDHLIITPFTRDFSNLLPKEYVKQILVEQIGTQHIIVGYDHRFGKDRTGSFNDLVIFGEEFGFDVEEIAEQDVNDVAVSSTKIRNSLLSGDVRTASQFLGYPFHLTGKVIKGDQIGRTLGFPTANILIAETYKLIPSDGIYAVTIGLSEKLKVESQKPTTDNPQPTTNNPQPTTDNPQPATDNPQPATPLKGMCYIGQRPTINGMTRNIEVNIFDFDQDIYGETIRLCFHHFIRGDVRFTSLDELKVQISKDKESAKLLLGYK